MFVTFAEGRNRRFTILGRFRYSSMTSVNTCSCIFLTVEAIQFIGFLNPFSSHRDGYSWGSVANLFLHVTEFFNLDWSYLTSHWSIAVTCENKLATSPK